MQNVFIRLIIFFILASFISCKNMDERKLDSLYNSEKNEIVSISDKAEKVEGDNKKNKIIKTTSENGGRIIEVITISNIVLTGEVVAVGDSTFNDLILITKEKESYTFKPEFKKQYWKYQSRTISVLCKVEKRTITDKKTGKILKKYWLFPIQ